MEKEFNMNIEKLTEKVQNELIGAKYLGCSWGEETLTNIIGKNCSCYDSRIDDGADDDETEDVYVMCDAFDIDGTDFVIHIYYGDVTREIGYVDVAEY